MKKIILLVTVLYFTVNMQAYDFAANGIYYDIISSTSPYKVEVTVETDNANSYTGDVVIPSTVINNSINYSVSAIGSYAFALSTSLISVVIPSSVTTIKSWAFMSCYDLTTVTMSTSVDTIGDGVFWGCIKLPAISIPASVMKIGSYVFYGCDNLTNIIVAEENLKFKSDQGLLYNKDKSKLLLYPAGKTELSYTISSFVDTIGDMAFGHCENLKSITIPTTVVYVTGHAFTQCNGLTSVFFPASVTYLNNNPFYDCAGMTAVTVDPANQYIESIDGVLFKKSLSTIIYYPPSKAGSSYVIPSTVNYTRSSVFMNCLNLTTVTIPSSVETIRSGLFSGCTNLTTINSYRTTPVDLTSIIPGNNSDDVFLGVDTLNCVLHVPAGSKSLYESAYQWKKFTHIVEGFSSDIPTNNVSTLKVIGFKGKLKISGFIKGETITVYTLQGKVIYKQKVNGEIFELAMPMQGVYIVKVGTERIKVVC